MVHWMDMRRNYNAYAVFYTHFVSTIVGKRLFKTRLATITEGEEIATVTDEALALLGIENSVARWDDIFDKSNGTIRRIRKGEAYPEEWKSTILPMFTGTAKADPDVDLQTEDKRWSQAGIRRFNALRKLVLDDRNKNPDFARRWLLDQRQKLQRKAADEANVTDDANIVDADDDLFGSGTPFASQLLNNAKQVDGAVDSSSDEDDDGYLYSGAVPL